MVNRLLTMTAAALAALTVSAATASAALIGSTVNVRYLVPNTSAVLADFGTFTINGTESLQVGPHITLSFNDSQLIISNLTAGQYGSATFSGYDVQLISGPEFLNVTVDGLSSPAFATGSVLTFSATQIMLNIQGVCGGCVGGEQIFLNVETADIPEPVSASFLAAGLLGLGAAGRYARRQGRAAA